MDTTRTENSGISGSTELPIIANSGRSEESLSPKSEDRWDDDAAIDEYPTFAPGEERYVEHIRRRNVTVSLLATRQ